MRLAIVLRSGFGFMVLTLLLSLTAHATVVCDPANPSDPGPEVVKNISELNCAVKDDFKSSCAYKEWQSGRMNASVATDAAAYAGRVSRLNDPNCDPVKNTANPCSLSATESEIFRTITGNPDFTKFYSTLTSNNPDEKDWSNINSMNGFSESKAKEYKRILGLLEMIDPLGAVKATLLLSQGVDYTDKTFSAEDKKRIIDKVALKGYEFRASKLEGCPKVRAKVKYTLENTVTYDRHPKGVMSKKEATPYKTESAERAKKYRTIESATDELKTCGEAFSSTYTTVGTIHSECSVNLPPEIFADNVATLTPAAESKMISALEEDECFKRGKADGLPIARIAVATSANTLNNTKNYCAREFDRLSADRAATIQGVVTNGLGAQVSPTTKFQLNSSGNRGDGSSGPCAYVAKEWNPPSSAPKGAKVFEVTSTDGKNHTFTEEPSPDFNSPAKMKNLEQYKYARVTIFYAEKTTPVDSGGMVQEIAGTSCRHLEFSCL